MAQKKPEDTSSESDVSDEEDDDLVLEGVIVRNPDVSDSDDTSSSSSSDDDDDDDDDDDVKPPPSKKAKQQETAETQNKEKKKEEPAPQKKKETKQKKKPKEGPEVIEVDFTFCDMHEKYFHGLKTLLTGTSPIYAAQSSGLADMMIKNVSVGTVISTEADNDGEGTIYGYASVLNLTTYQEDPAIQALRKICLDKCPAAHKAELQVVFSGKTKRPAGIYLQGRMVNLPLEIVEVLHQQLVLDMDWAVKNAEGVDRKSLDFGAFVRIAPAYKSGGATYFKYFDDEIFAQHAEFTFEIELAKSYETDEAPFCVALVVTKTGHRSGMEALSEMINGGAASW